MFANPFSLKIYDLQESLKRYHAYIEARLLKNATTEKVIEFLPTQQKDLANRRFAGGIEKPSVGKSVAHLRLDVVADEFRACLLDLKGKKLRCFCEETDPCHAKVLAELCMERACASLVRKRLE